MTDILTPVQLERFWAKVNKTDSCWEWTAAKDPCGYGKLTIERKTVSAHRLSYALAGNELGDLAIDHICHRRNCVNPGHLRLVTHKQNSENRSGAFANSRSGVRGVYWSKAANKWAAKVCHQGKPYYLGTFVKLEDAESAAIAKRNELFTHNNLDRAA